MARLKPGQQLRGLASGMTCTVQGLLGEGGQGEVYQVDLNGQGYAVKWYNDVVLQVDTGLKARLQVLIDRGPPSPRFIWPFELVTLPDGSRLGYLMRLRAKGYENIHALLTNAIKPTFRARATMGYLLTDALFAVHAKGLAYQDLNGGNVFVDEKTGDIEICDNDNVDIDGAPSVMGGVWEFQSPEVVLRQAGPTRASDLHSLAVMLFRILHIGHPLVGARSLSFNNLTSEATVRRLYGTEARFVFDPADDSNRPVAETGLYVDTYWSMYPQSLKDLFIRAFTEGLYDPNSRVMETEWRRAMSQLRDAVQTCPSCGVRNFYDGRRMANKQPRFTCWSCAEPIQSGPPRLGIRRTGARPGEMPLHVVILEDGATLLPHHTDGGEHEFNRPQAHVRGNPLALDNVSTHTWTATDSSGSRPVAPGESIELVSGLRIVFGRHEGEVKL